MKITRRLQLYTLKLFRLKDGAHRVALGMAAGFYPCWFPTFGIGPVISIALTKVVKGNVFAAIVAAAIGSVLWPLLFYMNYLTGHFIWRYSHTEIVLEDVDYSETVSRVDRLTRTGIEFLSGGAINSIVLTMIGYVLIYYIFKALREPLLRKLRGKNRLRQKAERSGRR